MKNYRMLMAIAIAAVTCAAFAQEPPQDFGGNRPDSGGPPRPPRMGPGGPPLILAPEVRNELHLTQEQINRIRDLMRPPHRGEIGGDAPPPPPEQVGMPQRPPRPGDLDPKIDSILDKTQRERYHQIRLQAQGPMALSRGEIADKLALSDEQRVQIHTILEENRPPRPPAPPEFGDENGVPPSPPRASDRKAAEENREKVGKKILAVLTPEQRKAWESLLGKPMKLGHHGPPPTSGRWSA